MTLSSILLSASLLFSSATAVDMIGDDWNKYEGTLTGTLAARSVQSYEFQSYDLSDLEVPILDITLQTGWLVAPGTDMYVYHLAFDIKTTGSQTEIPHDIGLFWAFPMLNGQMEIGQLRRTKDENSDYFGYLAAVADLSSVPLGLGQETKILQI